MPELQNDMWKVGVSELGAELQSMVNRAENREYIWIGDPEIWSGHAPLLFPIVGRQKDDLCDFGDGREYPMKAHGFARKSVFDIVEQTQTRLVLRLRDNEETRACYPFAFSLTSVFVLEGNTLTVSRTVCNEGDSPMPFLIGEHFGFSVPLDDSLAYEDYQVIFEHPENQPCWPLNENHYIDKPVPYLNGKGLPLDRHMFDGDARIFKDPVSRSVTLCSDRGVHGVTVDFPSYTSLGLWAKPCAPYLCIEPWVGHDSRQSDDHLFSHKDAVVVLGPHEAKTFTCIIKPF